MASYKLTCVLLLLTLLTESDSQLDVCGQAGFNTRIVGGQEAAPGSWPWQIALFRNGLRFCGGTLITREWVLTAAHCFPSEDTTNLVVLLGGDALGTPNPNAMIRTVSQIINHPNFNSTTLNNDISLVRLFPPVNFTSYILPVCLAASGSTFYNGTNTWATGWGNIGSGVAPPLPYRLREVAVPVVGNRQCNCDYGLGSVTDNMMCAGLQAGGKGICQGDGGGPLVSKQSSRWIQGGIASFGVGCALPNFPGVYTRVSQYQSWITSQITTDPPGFVSFLSTGTDSDLTVTCPALPPPVTLAPLPTATLCGQAGFNTRIVGGQEAAPGSWPWQVALFGNGSLLCGGTLITREWVLTAAQCFPSHDTTNLLVFLGSQTLITLSPYKVFRTVSQIINHPNFNSTTSNNDISLVRLSSPVTFTTHVLPVCLAASGSTFYNGTNTWVTGWGDIESGVAPPLPYRLREVAVPVVGNRQCNCDYGLGSVTDNMMCAGLQAGGKDTCQGDGGGPLVSKQSSRWIQGGIASFGAGCALPNFPGVYTRVSQYQSWITSQITTDPPGFVSFLSTGTDSDLTVTCPALPPPVTLPPLPTATLCGQAGFNTRIVGGQEAAPGSWPWQVALFGNGSLLCGGTLITREWVLTAAQCFPSHDTTNLLVFLGSQTLITLSPYKVFRTVSQIINHPNFNSTTSNNDISLVRLSSPVTFTTHVLPVCLAASGSTFYNGTNTWATGWGDIESGVAPPLPYRLREVAVPVVGNRQCNCDYGLGSVTDNMMCAGLQAGGKGICQGDGGGPLVSKQSSRWIQGGIASFGAGCALPNFPGVYTRVSQYQSWITSQITTDPPGFVSFLSTGTDSDLNVTCPTLPPPKPVYCGQAPMNSGQLGGGSVGSAGVWPWMASLQKKGSHVCGGTLVDVDAVLGDASCFSSSPIPSEWTVVLGRLKQKGSNPFEVTLNVTNITLSNRTGPNVAVLRLASRPPLSNYIQPICLDSGQTFSVGSTCWAAGWRTGQGGGEQVLQQYQTTVVNCGSSSSNSSICVEAFRLEKEDSGGPLMCQLAGSWFQAVVLTVNNSTSTRESAIMVFTRLSAFQDFLSGILGKYLSPAPSSNTTSTANSTSSPAHFFFFHLVVFYMCLLFF